MTENIMLTWALFYTKQGMSIIPTNGKESRVKWKEFQERRANEEEIKSWWAQWPDADIGCVTGKISGRLVLDIDGEEGKKSIETLDVPRTQQVRTRRGFQNHYKMVDVGSRTTVAGILPGVDVRGEGGICILPPSNCSDGSRYEWINGLEMPLLEMPEWLEKELIKPVEHKIELRNNSWIEEALEGIVPGDAERGRTPVFRSVVGHLHKKRVAPETIITLLRPWAERYGYDKLNTMVADICSRYPNAPELDENRSLEMLSANTLVTKWSKPPEFLVPGLIPTGTRTIFSGWQGRGKSFATTDLVIEISRKKGHGKWLGEFPVAKGPVIYIDNENARNLVAYRLEQLLKPKGISSADLDLHWVVGQHWKMTSEKDYQWLRNQVETIRPVLVVVDSLASVHSLDENTSKDMRYFFDDLVAPFCEEYGCGFMCIDHENKGQPGVHMQGGKRNRGSGAKGDAVDQMLSLDEQNGQVFIEHSKRRYTRKHAPFIVSIEDVGTGLAVKYGGELGPT